MQIDDIIARLRQTGHKVTPQRIAIIQIFMQSKEHLTPSALYERVHQVDPEVGEVTVYRTLNILSELGLVCTVQTGENSHSYISRPPEHHDHLICSECGKVVNFTGCNVAGLERRLESETGFSIQDHGLNFYGKCQSCSPKTKAKAGARKGDRG
jgi:Fur family transcriptional regulator, ferric uptake regulator